MEVEIVRCPDNAVRGAGRCPKCASRRVMRATLPIETPGFFYARTLETCVNCKATWKPFKPGDLLDPDDRNSSFKEPCDNCAFRPGSVEQRNTEKWASLMQTLKAGGCFYCHKGVPLDSAGEDGFAYPKDKNGKHNVMKMRLCRGYLNMLGAQLDKKYGPFKEE